jgi:predicted dehydrogenase
MKKIKNTTRRDFVKKSLTISGSFFIVPRFVLGGRGFKAPSETLTRAIIGVGGMGQEHLKYTDGRLLALCDVDEKHLKNTLNKVGKEVQGYRDYREVLERKDIDIVHIVTPPHWHGIIAADAARAGKDIWCEKPMTRTIGEGVDLVKIIQDQKRIFRLNTWFRFSDIFYGFGTTVKPIKKVVESGELGWPLKATISGVTGFDWKFYWVGTPGLPEQPVPKELDYDFWLGPAPYKPYNKERVHAKFRGYWDYDGGGLGDMGQHYLDPVQYILNKDQTSPVSVEVDAPIQDKDAVGTWRRIEYTYSDGCKIILDGENRDKEAAFLEGPNGKLYKNLESDIKGLKDRIDQWPDPELQVHDFTEAVKERKKFALNEQNGHRSCNIVNIGKVALQLNRSLNFDPAKQLFIDDDEANSYIRQPMRNDWKL